MTDLKRIDQIEEAIRVCEQDLLIHVDFKTGAANLFFMIRLLLAEVKEFESRMAQKESEK